MLREDFVLCRTRNLLNEFMALITPKADKPRQKFLRQAVGAILLSGSLIVTELGRWIHDDCSDIFYRLKAFAQPSGKPTWRLNRSSESLSSSNSKTYSAGYTDSNIS